MLLRLRPRGGDAPQSDGLETCFRRTVSFSRSFDWQLEFPLSIPLLDHR